MNFRFQIAVIITLFTVGLGQHRWIEGGPCEKGDVICMCHLGVQYTNDLRSKAGVPALEAGSIHMCNNAVAWSRHMADIGDLNAAGHQDIRGGVYVGTGTTCEAKLSSENIAQNNVPRSGPTDPVKLCMEQWRKSSGHYANIIRTGRFPPVNTVVGVYIGSDDRIWCTQTFSRVKAGKPNDTGLCKQVTSTGTQPPSGSSAPVAPTPTPSPKPKTQTTPTFKYKFVTMTDSSGNRTALEAKCTNVCVYCYKSNMSKCLSAERSKEIHDYLVQKYGR